MGRLLRCLLLGVGIIVGEGGGCDGGAYLHLYVTLEEWME